LSHSKIRFPFLDFKRRKEKKRKEFFFLLSSFLLWLWQGLGFAQLEFTSLESLAFAQLCCLLLWLPHSLLSSSSSCLFSSADTARPKKVSKIDVGGRYISREIDKASQTRQYTVHNLYCIAIK
jgi:hypothetical protein